MFASLVLLLHTGPITFPNLSHHGSCHVIVILNSIPTLTLVVGDVVPGVVVWFLCVYSHGWLGKCSEILAA